MLKIGIDCGVKTGFAVSQNGELRQVKTLKAVQAEAQILEFLAAKMPMKVYIEDARKRTWFGGAGRERLKGVGSVNRDCSRWQEFCEHYGIDFELVHPKNNVTKLDAAYFVMLTGWGERTSEHSRDAAMLVFKR